MSDVLSLAPPDGWQSWSDAEKGDWFATRREAKRSVGPGDQNALLKLTVLFELEGGAIGSRFPRFDQLNLQQGWIASSGVPALRKEVDAIRRELAELPLDRVVGPRTYIDPLDFDQQTDQLMANAALQWERAINGLVPVERLDQDDIDFQIRLFQAARPNGVPKTALDPFRPIFRAYHDMCRRSILRGRGLMLT